MRTPAHLAVLGLVAASGAVAQGVLNASTPVRISQCNPFILSWSGGVAPFNVFVFNGNDTAAGTRVDQIADQVTSQKAYWDIVTQPMDSMLYFRVEDSVGVYSETDPMPVITGLPMMNGTCVPLLLIGWETNKYISWGFSIGIILAIGVGLGGALLLVTLLAVYLVCCSRRRRFPRYNNTFGGVMTPSFDNQLTNKTGNTIVTYNPKGQESSGENNPTIQEDRAFTSPKPTAHPFAQGADGTGSSGAHPYANIVINNANGSNGTQPAGGSVSRNNSVDSAPRPKLSPRVDAPRAAATHVLHDDEDDLYDAEDDFAGGRRNGGNNSRTVGWREALNEAPTAIHPRPSMSSSSPPRYNYNPASRQPVQVPQSPRWQQQQQQSPQKWTPAQSPALQQQEWPASRPESAAGMYGRIDRNDLV